MAQTTQPRTVGDILDGMKNLSTFNNLLRRSGIIAQVDAEGPFTILAPSNGAFDRLPPHAISEIVHEPHTLEDFVRNHIVTGIYAREGLTGETLRTVLGTELTVVDVDPGPYVGGARVLEGDLMAENGIVHVIDAILMPERA